MTPEELAKEIQRLVEEPGQLYKEGLAELTAEYGGEDKIPLTARTENAKMAAGYEAAGQNLAKVATLAFDYAAGEMGVTGFQATWAQLVFLRESRGINGPFRIVDADDYLYPQSQGKVSDWLEDDHVKEYLRESALAKLENADDRLVHPDVKAHWAALATDPNAKLRP